MRTVTPTALATLACAASFVASPAHAQTTLRGSGTGTLSVGRQRLPVTRVKATLAGGGRATLRVGSGSGPERTLTGWWSGDGSATVKLSLRLAGAERSGISTGTLRVARSGRPALKSVAEVRLRGGAREATPFAFDFTGKAGTGAETRTLTGSVSYRERILLPNPTVRVRLIDPSRPGQALAERTLTPSGGPPYPFTLTYKVGDLAARKVYRVVADILVDGRVRFTGAAPYPGATPRVEILAKAPPTGEDPATMAERVTGEAFFLERIALPPGALLTVHLRLLGTDAIIARVTTAAKNGNTPFVLSYDPAKIDKAREYMVEASIADPDGKTLFRSRDAYKVITSGSPSTVKVRLVRGE